MSFTSSWDSTGNRLLNKLPQVELERLLPHSKYIQLSRGEILYELGDTIRYISFPVSGIVSMLSTSSDGNSIEIGSVGNEGMIGMPLVLRGSVMPCLTVVHVAGEALRFDAETFKKELTHDGQLEDRLFRYANSLLSQISHAAVCNHFHTNEARLSRWLLVSRDQINANTFLLTQEVISHVLGISRTGVTKAANNLVDAGLIRCRRGKITIVNRRGLQDYACECYSMQKEECDKLNPTN
jgi:CRP-like cAMP-binding protein